MIRFSLYAIIILCNLITLLACNSETSNSSQVSTETMISADMETEVSSDMFIEQPTEDMSEVIIVEPWLRIGTGFRRYESLEDGQDVPIIAGIQGGFHVWGAFLGEGFDDIDLRVMYSMELDGEVLARADYTEFELPKNSRGEFEYAGVSVIYFENDDVERTSGEEFLLKLRIETRDGMSLEDQIVLRPQCCE
ncbi:MAG: hypothetical protein CMH49_08820 [Myxococcales bacterium]|nr:hypothetical protein [Myxococcales bacterium]